MRGAIFAMPQYAFMAWCSVKKGTGKFTFTFINFTACLSVCSHSILDALILMKCGI
jgi:hypothetical protein